MAHTNAEPVDVFIEQFHADPETILIAALEALAVAHDTIARYEQLIVLQAEAITALHNLAAHHAEMGGRS